MFSFKKKTEIKSSKFSEFFREADSRTRTKVFKKAGRKALEDQRKILYGNS